MKLINAKIVVKIGELYLVLNDVLFSGRFEKKTLIKSNYIIFIANFNQFIVLGRYNLIIQL